VRQAPNADGGANSDTGADRDASFSAKNPLPQSFFFARHEETTADIRRAAASIAAPPSPQASAADRDLGFGLADSNY
jgi:hypothetical protein